MQAVAAFQTPSVALRWTRAANKQVKEWPLTTACAVASTKNSVCDALVQLGTEGKVDLRRNLTFVAFGFGWVGAGQFFLFNRLYPRLFSNLLASNPDAKTVAAVTILDNFVHIPLLYLPIFYATREVATTTKPLRDTVEGAISCYKRNFIDDVLMQAGIFVPAQAFNFALNPPHLRVPFLVGVGVLWVSLLSFFRGDREADA